MKALKPEENQEDQDEEPRVVEVDDEHQDEQSRQF